MEDILRSLGLLVLGSRFRRLGERLQSDTQRLLDQLDVSIPAGQHPFLAALDRFGPLTVGDLAETIGITQPGATRSVGKLVRLGLVAAKPALGDQRQKIVSLTREGKRLVAVARRDVWPRVEVAVADLCRDLTGPLLDQLAMLEDELAALPLDRRAPKAKARKDE